MPIYKCKTCGDPFSARKADRDRGWARYCSKSCKAKRQAASAKRHSTLPRPDGRTPMKYKRCHSCGEPAVNGVYTADGIEWFCERHEHDATTHPFDPEALGQS